MVNCVKGDYIDEIKQLPAENDFNIRLRVYEYQIEQGHISKDELLGKTAMLVLDYIRFKRHQTIEEINEKKSITVIDSVMGSGKTSWAIDYMNGAADENILYITPFRKEIERIQKAVTQKDIKTPQIRGKDHFKMDDLKDLFELHEDIASTHSLFSDLKKETTDLIQQGEYTLILDEALNAVEPYNGVKKDDIDFLLKKRSIMIDKDGYINWIDSEFAEKDFKYAEIRNLAMNHSLFYVNDKILMWNYPSEIFRAFKKVFIMTYMFDANIMYYYFRLNQIKYQVKSITQIDGKYELCQYYKPDVKIYKDLIHIDRTGIKQKKDTALSSKWYERASKATKDKIKASIYNWVRNIVKAKSNEVMWTTFKEQKSKLQGKGYTGGFVEWNCKATNDYSDKKYLAYALNVYPHVGIVQFFSQHGIKVNKDLFALSEMIQWVWRSAIRNGEEIHILIISDRMRLLFGEWLSGILEYEPNTYKVLNVFAKPVKSRV